MATTQVLQLCRPWMSRESAAQRRECNFKLVGGPLLKYKPYKPTNAEVASDALAWQGRLDLILWQKISRQLCRPAARRWDGRRAVGFGTRAAPAPQ